MVLLRTFAGSIERMAVLGEEKGAAAKLHRGGERVGLQQIADHDGWHGHEGANSGGCPTMNAGTRQILQVAEPAPKRNHSNGELRTSIAAKQIAARENGGAVVGRKPRVFVAAGNRLLKEALSRMLAESGGIEVVGTDIAEPFRAEDLLREETDILILSSGGNGNEDLTAVRMVRTTAPKVQILLIGVTG